MSNGIERRFRLWVGMMNGVCNRGSRWHCAKREER